MIIKNSIDNAVWKDIDGLDGRYSISSCGKVWSNLSNKMMKPQGRNNKTDGYLQIGLLEEGSQQQIFFLIHRLVAHAFMDLDIDSHDVLHKDKDGANNHIDNLYLADPHTHQYTLPANRAVGVRERITKKGIVYGGYYYQDGKQVHVGTFSSHGSAEEAVKKEIANVES